MRRSTSSRRLTLTAAGLAVAGAGVAVACGGGSEATAPVGPAVSELGALTVQITDVPFPFDSVARVDVYVRRVDAKVRDTDSTEAAAGAGSDPTNGDPSRGWVTVAKPDRTVDLLALNSGIVDSLGVTSLPVGTYSGFRLIIDTERSSITLKNGTVLTGQTIPGTSVRGIRFPTIGVAGLRIELREPIVVTSAGAKVVIDFDLAKSFTWAGRDISRTGLEFKPVVRGLLAARSGGIAGRLRFQSATGNGVPQATVEILSAGTAASDTARAHVLATTHSGEGGGYVAAFLAPGTYAVRASRVVDGTLRTGYLAQVTVTAGTRTAAPDIVVQ